MTKKRKAVEEPKQRLFFLVKNLLKGEVKNKNNCFIKVFFASVAISDYDNRQKNNK
ncbi:hypothetical protein [Enterococcus sp. DIV2371]|uniref:hypothetical protein n=1 Tax=unclassified Enterococcus TaxID=2608891 RepID=UPI001ACC05BC|nr:hypothetical protein [Enterococcus sp. DIV1271a]